MQLAKVFMNLAKMREEAVLRICLKSIGKLGYKVISDNLNYVVGVPATPSPLCLIAHCDTVGKAPPKHIRERCGVLDACGEVLGADDRAGVAAIWMVLNAGHRPMLVFTQGEERGCVGSKQLLKDGYTPPDEVAVLVQLDRRNCNDFVTYSCDSPALDAWVEGFGYVKEWGTRSDISELAPAWKIAAANLSVGYTEEHRDKERLYLPALQHTIDRVGEMIKHPPDQRLEYLAKNYGYQGRAYHGEEHDYHPHYTGMGYRPLAAANGNGSSSSANGNGEKPEGGAASSDAGGGWGSLIPAATQKYCYLCRSFVNVSEFNHTTALCQRCMTSQRSGIHNWRCKLCREWVTSREFCFTDTTCLRCVALARAAVLTAAGTDEPVY